MIIDVFIGVALILIVLIIVVYGIKIANSKKEKSSDIWIISIALVAFLIINWTTYDSAAFVKNFNSVKSFYESAEPMNEIESIAYQHIKDKYNTELIERLLSPHYEELENLRLIGLD
jgi:energy-coupling factor transporter transmembrane protein EcfT